MQEMPEHQITVEPRHYHAGGVYAREVFLPAGTLVTGKIHRTEHMTILSMGRVRVFTDTEEAELVAPATFVSQPGTKRAVLVLEDAVWTTIHANPTRETDLDKLEAVLIAPSYEALENPSWHG